MNKKLIAKSKRLYKKIQAGKTRYWKELAEITKLLSSVGIDDKIRFVRTQDPYIRKLENEG